MSDSRQIIDMMPLRSGLATAGRRSTINENQVWAAQNAYPDLDGMMRRRPGLNQHGQTITIPDGTTDNHYHEMFWSTSSWETPSGTGDAIASTESGMLTFSQSTGEFYLSRRQEDLSSGGNYSFKFSMKMINPIGVDTTGGTIRVRVSGDGASTMHEYVITADGIYVVEGGSDVQKYTPTLKLDLGGFHIYGFYYNLANDSTQFYFDDSLIETWDMSSADNLSGSKQGNTKTVEFWFHSGVDRWTVNLVDLQYSDADLSVLPFTGQALVDGVQFSLALAGGKSREYLLVATDNLLYADIGERGIWRAIKNLLPGHTFMLPFRNDLIIFDDDGSTNSKVYSWDGVGDVEPLDDAPPMRFATEYKSRLFGAGDRAFPLRLYFSGSRQKNVWFSPEYDSDETFDEVIGAGFIEIPAETGDEITGVYGEFLGSLIIATEKGIWQMTGSSTSSYRIENISKQVGVSSPHGMVQIGSELFGVGPSGVSSLKTAQTYGDLQTGMPSGAIADKWSSIPDIQGRVDKNQLDDSYFSFLPSLNIAVLGMRGQGSETLDKTFVFSPMTQQWMGPWTNNPTFFAKVSVGVTKTELLMNGHIDGKVTFTGLRSWDDVGASYEFKMESPMLSGRTLNPLFNTLIKRWRRLRLFILPRVNRDFMVRWKTDLDGWQPGVAGKEFSQNRNNEASLNGTFLLNVDRLHSQEDIATIDIPLEARGRYLQFEITSNYEFVLQGYQVEFLFSQKED